jgi:intracellular multiplication protein IcmB
MLAIFKTKNGTSKLPLINTLSPEILWAFSTTAEDMALREALYRYHDTESVLKFLSERFPGGIKREAERRARLMGATGKSVMEVIISELEAELAKEMARKPSRDPPGKLLGNCA